jgi:hypothetical protein
MVLFVIFVMFGVGVSVGYGITNIIALNKQERNYHERMSLTYNELHEKLNKESAFWLKEWTMINTAKREKNI